MVLFCAAIRRDSVSLLKFLNFSHIHVFSCEISLVSRLKCPLSYFSSDFCFFFFLFVLSVLLPVAVISFLPRFSM